MSYTAEDNKIINGLSRTPFNVWKNISQKSKHHNLFTPVSFSPQQPQEGFGMGGFPGVNLTEFL